MKKIALLLFFWIAINGVFAQNKEEFLNTKLGENLTESLLKLQKEGIITKYDVTLLGNYLLSKAKDNINFADWTYTCLLDSLHAYKQRLNREIAKKNCYGKDSVFMRTPAGDKIFWGLGEMSMEGLVDRESKNLPLSYQDELMNQKISSLEQISKSISDLKLTNEMSMLFGNVILILMDKKEILSDYRIGDLLEITKRIKASKELMPFLTKDKN
jgi:hypothetical protein